jgi:hypothetical protein
MGRSVQNSVFSPAHFAEAAPACLAGWHSRWLVDCPVLPDSSTFLRSLRSIPVTGLLRYYGRSDSCEARRRFSPSQVSLIHVSDLPIPPSPTTPQALDADFARYPSSRRVSCLRRSRLHHFPAGSPTLTGRIEFVILRNGWIVHLLLLPTPPHGDAVAVGYRPERACLKRTSTSLTKRAFRRTGTRARRAFSTLDSESPRGSVCTHSIFSELQVRWGLIPWFGGMFF